eukprot:1076621-Rhodomonas_salina.1
MVLEWEEEVVMGRSGGAGCSEQGESAKGARAQVTAAEGRGREVQARGGRVRTMRGCGWRGRMARRRGGAGILTCRECSGRRDMTAQASEPKKESESLAGTRKNKELLHRRQVFWLCSRVCKCAVRALCRRDGESGGEGREQQGRKKRREALELTDFCFRGGRAVTVVGERAAVVDEQVMRSLPPPLCRRSQTFTGRRDRRKERGNSAESFADL